MLLKLLPLMVLLLIFDNKILTGAGTEKDVQTQLLRIPVHNAAAFGTYEDICFFLEKNVDSNVQDKFLRSPLHKAAWKNNVQTFTALIEHKARVDVQDFFGDTPLHVALACNNIAVFALLLSHSADVTLANNAGSTPKSIVNRRLNTLPVRIEYSRLDKDLTREDQLACMKDIVQNEEDSTPKERLQVIKAMLQDPELAQHLSRTGLSTKNARNI